MSATEYGRAFALWRDAAPGWQAYTHHAFVEGLRRGDLPRANFLHYLRQVYVFLIHFSRAWALAAAKADTLAEMQATSATVHALVHHEMPLHVQICAREGIDAKALEATEEAPANLAYTRYLPLHFGRFRPRRVTMRNGTYRVTVSLPAACRPSFRTRASEAIGGDLDPFDQQRRDAHLFGGEKLVPQRGCIAGVSALIEDRTQPVQRPRRGLRASISSIMQHRRILSAGAKGARRRPSASDGGDGLSSSFFNESKSE